MKLALQLYSMRDCADQIALLGQLPALGITHVEGYGGVYGDPVAYRAAMDATGISMPSGHMGLAEIEEDFEATGWHNHDFEFFALPDGSIPMDVLLNAAPDIAWEADLAWIVRGGSDPIDYINRYGSRLSAIHVKDIAAAGTNLDEDGWSDLGAGTMDWAALLQACRSTSGDLIYALEHDKPSDPVGYAGRSAAAFKTLWESTHD